MSIELLSSSGQAFPVSIHAIQASVVISDLIDDFKEIHKETDNKDKIGPIPLDEIESATLKKVIEWCEDYASTDPTLSDFLKEKDKQYRLIESARQMMALGKEELFDLISAANYLDINALRDCSCKAAANLIVDRSLNSLAGLPVELQTSIGEHLPPHALLEAIASRLVPETPGIQRRVKHAQVWATLFTAQDISLLERATSEIYKRHRPNVILLGSALENIYNGQFNLASERPSPAHIVLILNQFHVFKLNPELLHGDFWVQKINLESQSIILHAPTTHSTGFYHLDHRDLCRVVDLVTLKTCAVYFKDEEFKLHHINLKKSQRPNGYDFKPNPLLFDRCIVVFYPISTMEEREYEEASYLNWKKTGGLGIERW